MSATRESLKRNFGVTGQVAPAAAGPVKPKVVKPKAVKPKAVTKPAEIVPHEEPSGFQKKVGKWLKGLLGKRKGDMVKNYARGGGVRPANNEYK